MGAMSDKGMTDEHIGQTLRAAADEFDWARGDISEAEAADFRRTATEKVERVLRYVKTPVMPTALDWVHKDSDDKMEVLP